MLGHMIVVKLYEVQVSNSRKKLRVVSNEWYLKETMSLSKLNITELH